MSEKNNINNKLGKIGGMALLEGVMMKSKEKISMAVRKNDGTIEIATTVNDNINKKLTIDKIPIVRGCFAFVDSLISGIKAITDSARMIDIKDNDGDKVEITNVEITISVIIALIIALVIFFAAPNFIANLIFPLNIAENRLAYNLVESSVKLVIFLLYILGVSNLNEIKRIFMYHGAEHKTVNAYENVKDSKLSVNIVKEYSRFHARCGSSFIVLVLIVGFIVSYFIMIPNFWIRLVIKFICLPLIAGFAYELIRYNGKHVNLFTKITSAPRYTCTKNYN